MTKTLTIFTPTYNRAYILPQLYESLVHQTNNSFVWLIVDDGSTDNTKELVDVWIKEGKIEIVYHAQLNQGKHIAHNQGVRLCETPLFFCVDSDDYLSQDAVSSIVEIFKEEQDNSVLGLYMRRGDYCGIPTGQNWPEKIKYTTINGLYQKYHFRGETAIILKTAMIRPFSFPQFKNEKFVRESVLYDQINNLGLMRVDNRVCYLFEYKEDGYTAQGMKLEFDNPKATAYNYLHHIPYTRNIIEKFKFMAQYYAWQHMFKIQESLFETIKTPFYIKFGGRLLEIHYLNLFRKLKEALKNEA